MALNTKGNSVRGVSHPTSYPTGEHNPGLEDLAQVLRADLDTGQFHWLVGQRAGHVAGFANDRGYVLVRLWKRNYRAHRLMWLFAHEQWPAQGIDHINGDRGDNRIANLRECDQSQNMENVHKRKRSACGFAGTVYDPVRKRFKATITVRGKRHRLGYFKTGEAAAEAYERAKADLHQFANETALRTGGTV
ncbi:HNH endonuclease signature motif containing protein [Methylobacterium sp. CM6244]